MTVKHIIATLFAVTVFALVGCGTTATPITQAIEVPPDRVMAKASVSSSNPAMLTLVRDTGLHGAEHVFEFWVNGQQIAELKAGEKLTTAVEPGPVFLEIRMFNILGKIAPAQVETTFLPGATYVYRAGLDAAPSLHLARDLGLSRQ